MIEFIKPSKRIYEIANKKIDEERIIHKTELYGVRTLLEALIQYLDEQQEKQRGVQCD